MVLRQALEVMVLRQALLCGRRHEAERTRARGLALVLERLAVGGGGHRDGAADERLYGAAEALDEVVDALRGRRRRVVEVALQALEPAFERLGGRREQLGPLRAQRRGEPAPHRADADPAAV